jgi:hypothetical protein
MRGVIPTAILQSALRDVFTADFLLRLVNHHKRMDVNNDQVVMVHYEKMYVGIKSKYNQFFKCYRNL